VTLDSAQQRPVGIHRCGEGEGSPLGFYERYGFERTGDRVFDNEILLRLTIT